MNRKLKVIKGNTVTQMAQPYNVIHEGISMFKMAVQKNALTAKIMSHDDFPALVIAILEGRKGGKTHVCNSRMSH